MQLEQHRSFMVNSNDSSMRQTGSLENPADMYSNSKADDYSTIQPPTKGFQGKKLTTIRVNGNKAVVVASPTGSVPKKQGMGRL